MVLKRNIKRRNNQKAVETTRPGNPFVQPERGPSSTKGKEKKTGREEALPRMNIVK